MGRKMKRPEAPVSFTGREAGPNPPAPFPEREGGGPAGGDSSESSAGKEDTGLKTLLQDSESERGLGRRRFLALGAAALAGLAPGALAQTGIEQVPVTDRFVFARLKYAGGDWFTDMAGQGLVGSAEIQFLQRLVANTRIRAAVREFALSPGDRRIGEFPFLYITGHARIQMTGVQMERLRQAITGGSILVADACVGTGPFRQSVISLLDQVLPEGKLEILPMTHPVFHCLYEIPEVLGGDKRVHDYIEGITLADRLAVIYTDNDLGCAWEGHPCRPDGEKQRENAFRLGMNIVAYALTH